ncbi:Acyl-coenzyme A thioesterase 8 [Apiospora kogelbergensis]|uniref:Acyl-coenzyme A thioesterase 8 n=1 Tax=Apiospora kogelbergensis TaxID=1337665 RepID=UPI00312E5084
MSPQQSPPPPPPAGDNSSSRLSFQEYMQLVPLPEQPHAYGTPNGQPQQKRYMSQRASWMPGIDLPSPMREHMTFKGAAYGGHVYSQSGLAASLTFAEMREKLIKAGKGKGLKGKVFGIHTIHGYFSEAGLIDRPFIYEVTPVSTANLAFANFSVTARQPQAATSSPSGDHYPLTDAVASPLGPICFTALVSFRPTSSSQVVTQEDPPQQRFASILGSRPPSQWEPAPLVDIDRVVAMLPPGKKRGSGGFPCVDMKKVDMREYNEGRPLHERRELILYRRILSPEEKKKAEKGEKEEPDAHILTHAFEADRNGLLMCGNHVGFGDSLARAATLSYSFVVHVSPEEAIMRTPQPKQRKRHQLPPPPPPPEQHQHQHHHQRPSVPLSLIEGINGVSHGKDHEDERKRREIQERYARAEEERRREEEERRMREEEEEAKREEEEEWWIQEATFPRVEANRCVVMSKIWSPQGKHVATEYQDGIIKSSLGRSKGDNWSKL